MGNSMIFNDLNKNNTYSKLSVFLIMKFNKYILILILPILSACPTAKSPTKDANELYSNRMNFKKWEKNVFYDISFLLPEKFEEKKYSHITISSKKSLTKSIESLSLYFSVEIFDETKASEISYLLNEPQFINAVQSNYVKRINYSNNSNYEKLRISNIKKIGKENKCISQVLIQNFNRQNKWDVDYTLTYFVATKKIKSNFYVFQFIGKSTNMNYLYDDFLRIVESAN